MRAETSLLTQLVTTYHEKSGRHQECLDRVSPLGERHFRQTLSEYDDDTPRREIAETATPSYTASTSVLLIGSPNSVLMRLTFSTLPVMNVDGTTRMPCCSLSANVLLSSAP